MHPVLLGVVILTVQRCNCLSNLQMVKCHFFRQSESKSICISWFHQGTNWMMLLCLWWDTSELKEASQLAIKLHFEMLWNTGRWVWGFCSGTSCLRDVGEWFSIISRFMQVIYIDCYSSQDTPCKSVACARPSRWVVSLKCFQEKLCCIGPIDLPSAHDTAREVWLMYWGKRCYAARWAE